MGSGNFSANTYAKRSSVLRSMSREETFSSRMDPSMSPYQVTRESRDSDDHPESNAAILAFDVTGSMGSIPEYIVKEGLGTLMSRLLSDKTNGFAHPQFMVMGVGDDKTDRYPLQVSQFESDIRIVSDLQRIFLEGGGGGNAVEGYTLPWLFASRQTSIDCWEKRRQKGFLFTMGDEGVNTPLRRDILRDKKIADIEEDSLDAETLLEEVSEKYEVFHLIIAQGGWYARMEAMKGPDEVNPVLYEWRNLLGNRAILVTDYQLLPTIIASVISITRGADPYQILSDLDQRHHQAFRIAFGL